MNYISILDEDIANGIGFRTSIWVAGCTKHCAGCFNSEAFDFNAGKEFDGEVLEKLMGYIGRGFIDGLSILGGEPLHPRNIDGVLWMIKELRKRFGGSKDIWVWTGYELEKLWNDYPDLNKLYELLQNIDVLVDGEFVIEKRDLSLAFRGSANQRLIDVPATLKSKEIRTLKKC